MNRDTSAYVHFPWCWRKCPYCDFATRAIDPASIPHQAYADAVVRQVESYETTLDGRRLVSVFFGGGTPSLWDPRQIGRVLVEIRRAFTSEVDALEVTVECNPSSLDSERVRIMRQEGVTRLSLGVQSLSDRHLRFLGRLHDANAALTALDVATRAELAVSTDIMFGMPGQTRTELIDDLTQVLERGVDHLSVYALTIEPGTRFGELHRKHRLAIAPDGDYAHLYLEAEAYLIEHGFDHYEVSNYARGAQSVHNGHYWQGGDYLGLGAGAVGCLTNSPGHAVRTRNAPGGEQWLGDGEIAEREVLGPQELIREGLMLGLRTSRGANLSEIEARAGTAVAIGRERSIKRGTRRGDLLANTDVWRVPSDRWLRLDGIVADLF